MLEDDARFGPGVIGSAFSFDGEGDFVSLESQPNVSTALTVTAWVKIRESDLDDYNSIFNNKQFAVVQFRNKVRVCPCLC